MSDFKEFRSLLGTSFKVEEALIAAYEWGKHEVKPSIEKLKLALNTACRRHHMNCDKTCVQECPVRIKRAVLKELGDK